MLLPAACCTAQVSSGQLAALDVPLAAANLDASKLVDTYGKTFHTWQVDAGHLLPYGKRIFGMLAYCGPANEEHRVGQDSQGHGLAAASIRTGTLANQQVWKATSWLAAWRMASRGTMLKQQLAHTCLPDATYDKY
jgi:hypothetical protein